MPRQPQPPPPEEQNEPVPDEEFPRGIDWERIPRIPQPPPDVDLNVPRIEFIPDPNWGANLLVEKLKKKNKEAPDSVKKLRCLNCGLLFVREALAIHKNGLTACKDCYPRYGQCLSCGYIVPPEDLEVGNNAADSCSGCGIGRRSRLKVPQQLRFTPSRNVLESRRVQWPEPGTAK